MSTSTFEISNGLAFSDYNVVSIRDVLVFGLKFKCQSAEWDDFQEFQLRKNEREKKQSIWDRFFFVSDSGRRHSSKSEKSLKRIR